MNKCSVVDCKNNSVTTGLCMKHYTRKIRHGTTEDTRIMNDDKKRLMSSIVINSNECWIWQKFKKNGYGVTYLNGKLEQAHRAFYKVYKGEIPNGMQLNHICHNRDCVNPDHVYVGNQKENMQDMLSAKRQNYAKGNRNGVSKLKESIVKEIKEHLLSGCKCNELARIYKVAATTISSIKTGRTWNHVV